MAGSVKIELEDTDNEPGTIAEEADEDEGVQEENDQSASVPGLGRDALLGRLNTATEENSTSFHVICVE